MSLTASMWTSVSGLLAHGEKMNVIGNNISNVNTVGYKNQRMDFQDFVYQYVGTASGTGQVGRGTNIGAIMNDFSQGSLETTTSATDIAIFGNGFFCVKPLNNDMDYYTRAGNFTFDRNGYLVNPQGYVLQGWEIDKNMAAQNDPNRSGSGIIGTGAPTDIKLDTFTCPPRHTTNAKLPIKLRNAENAGEDDKSSDADDPFFALLKTWDATQEVPLGTDKRAYQTTMEVYDEGGRMHKLTIYFDRVSNQPPISGYTTGESYWEFIVTMNPSEDVRDFTAEYSEDGANPTSPNVPEKLKGLLGAGTMTFNSSGDMTDMSCFVPHTDPSDGTWWTGSPGQETVDLSKWIPAPISSNGVPMIAPNFSGTAGLANAFAPGIMDKPNPNGSDRMIALDFGLKTKQNAWQFPASTTVLPPEAGIGWDGMTIDWGNRLSTLDPNAIDPNGYPLDKDGNLLNTGGPVWDSSQLATTPYPPVQRKDKNGQPMNMYLVPSENGTPLPPGDEYYTTDISSLSAGDYGPAIPVMDPDHRSMFYIHRPDGLVSAADMGKSKNNIKGMDGFAMPSGNNGTRCEGTGFQELSGKTQDGYTYGDFRSVHVSTDGVLSASYSNGVTLQLYQVVLYDFPSNQNLRREGGNLFTETRESGVPSSGAAGTGSFGTTNGNSLEQSNADLSREFVNMITTQRGFQANSKTITTVDTMLETVIGMKR